MVIKYEKYTFQERKLFTEAVAEIYEHEEEVYCRKCCQMETLTFTGDKLSSGQQKWTQLSNGHVVHNCNGKTISLSI